MNAFAHRCACLYRGIQIVSHADISARARVRSLARSSLPRCPLFWRFCLLVYLTVCASSHVYQNSHDDVRIHSENIHFQHQDGGTILSMQHKIYTRSHACMQAYVHTHMCTHTHTHKHTLKRTQSDSTTASCVHSTCGANTYSPDGTTSCVCLIGHEVRFCMRLPARPARLAGFPRFALLTFAIRQCSGLMRRLRTMHCGKIVGGRNGLLFLLR